MKPSAGGNSNHSTGGGLFSCLSYVVESVCLSELDAVAAQQGDLVAQSGNIIYSLNAAEKFFPFPGRVDVTAEFFIAGDDVRDRAVFTLIYCRISQGMLNLV